MAERSAVLQTFLEAVKRGFDATNPRGETKACLDRVFDALETPAAASAESGARVSTNSFLEEALRPAMSGSTALRDLADSIRALEPMLTWRRRAGASPNASASYAEGHANTMVVGPGGLEDRPDAWVGMSLMEPGVRYPDHTHSPEEIYLVLTDGQFRHGTPDWFTPGVGGTLYNEPGIEHAMRAPDKAPFLAIWCLFDDRHQRNG